jgi:capsular polysaccharide biosynthesis protein
MNINEDIRFDDFRSSFLNILKHRTEVLLAGLIAFAAGIILTWNGSIVDVYGATASVYSAVYSSDRETDTAISAMTAYSDIVTSNKVCKRALAMVGDPSLSVGDIQGMISARASGSSVIMNIYAYSSDPKKAVSVANAVAQAFVMEIQEITGTDYIQQLDTPDSAYMSSNGFTSLWKNRIMFLVAGIVIAALWFFVRELFSDRVRLVEQCVLLDDDVILGIVPDFGEKK